MNLPLILAIAVLVLLAYALAFERDALRGTRPPRPMSLKNQDTRSYYARYFDSYLKLLGFAFVALVIIMPIVMTTFFHLYPDAFK